MIIFLYGADTFRSRRLLQEMKNKFIKDVDADAQSLTWLDGQNATLAEISEKINTGSLFVKKRMVIIENIFKNKRDKVLNELADYLKKFTKDDDNVIILRDAEINTKDKPLRAEMKKLFAFLSQQPYVQEFKTLSNSQLLLFVKQEAVRLHKKINASAASLLISLTGGDLWLIAGEIKKLAHYTNEEEITPEVIREVTPGNFSEDIFALTDALSTRDKTLAAKLLTEQYEAGLSDDYILTMLIRQFKILLQIKAALENQISANDLAAHLKIHPFVAKKGVWQAKNFSIADLKNYLNALIRLDFFNKTGQSDLKTELTLLIAKL